MKNKQMYLFGLWHLMTSQCHICLPRHSWWCGQSSLKRTSLWSQSRLSILDHGTPGWSVDLRSSPGTLAPHFASQHLETGPVAPPPCCRHTRMVRTNTCKHSHVAFKWIKPGKNTQSDSQLKNNKRLLTFSVFSPAVSVSVIHSCAHNTACFLSGSYFLFSPL